MNGKTLLTGPDSFRAIPTLLRHLPDRTFSEHRDEWGLWKAFRKALIEAVAIFLTLRFRMANKSVDQRIISNLEDIDKLQNSNLTEVFAKLPSAALVRNAIDDFLLKESSRWESIVETFPERSQYYQDLAELAHHSGNPSLARQLLEKAVSNAVGYGYHKDLTLLESIEAIKYAHEAGSLQGRNWLSTLVPIAREAGNFTDGDETSRLLVDLAAVCRQLCPDVLFSMYIGLSRYEELFLAEDVFVQLVSQLDLSDPFQRALASAVVDDDSRTEIEKRAAPGDVRAGIIAQELQAFCGDLGKSRDSYEQSPARRSELPDVKIVDPDGLFEFLQGLTTPYDREQFIVPWFKYQVEIGNPRKAYFATKKWVEESDYYWVGEDILIELIPFAEEFEGPQKGFELLVKAGIDSHCWSRFGSDKKAIGLIWDILESRYQQRWLDFVNETCRRSLFGRPLGKLQALPASLGTQFLARFGQLENVEDLASASVRNVQDLMADLKLPLPNWFDDKREALDVLVARISWISVIVRERAAFQLSRLLCDPATSSVTFSALVNAIRREPLESRVINLLLPILRATRAGTKISITELQSAIGKPSVITEEILKEMA